MSVADDDRLARDARHRILALDPRRSFLVQAPAGSGKTELLIQRYLALLATVPSPQRVVAVTFTRKAANEMRERVIAALRDARDETRRRRRAHARRHARAGATRSLAHATALGWSILDYPAQLDIGTIDALCGRIARQAPLTSRLGASPRPSTMRAGSIVEAARATLAACRRRKRVLAHAARAARQRRRIARPLPRRASRASATSGCATSSARDAVDGARALEALLAAEIEAELALARRRLRSARSRRRSSTAGATRRAFLAQCEGDAAQRMARLLRAHGGLPPPDADACRLGARSPIGCS